MAKGIREKDPIEPTKVVDSFKSLVRVVQEEYIRQMKKCIVLQDMQNPESHEKYMKLKIPLRLSKRTAPYSGVVDCPQYNYHQFYEEVMRNHWCSDQDMNTMTKIFSKKCIDFLQQRYMNTNLASLKLPKSWEEMNEAQKQHHKTVASNISIQWREFLIGEIQDKLRHSHDGFFDDDRQKYQTS